VAERFDRLEEQLAIVTGLWTTPAGQRFSFAGKHYTLTDSPALPKPVQRPRPPVIVGGKGAKRTPRLAAAYADEFNVAFISLEASAAQFQRVREACQAAGRDPDGLVYSVAQTVVCGSDQAEVRRRGANIGREGDVLRASTLAGTPDEVVEQLERFAAIGAQRAYLQLLDIDDLDHVDLLASEVRPRLA
jgi:alkanesulfonate monooxygenase SsuD/methylene tetrahydromethanopterin reductase-like flavin-dependent oxidoreductase (luciferase family)